MAVPRVTAAVLFSTGRAADMKAAYCAELSVSVFVTVAVVAAVEAG